MRAAGVAPLDERRDERRPLRDGAEREARRPPRLLAARGQGRRVWRDGYDRGEAPAHLYTTYFVISRRRRGVQARSAGRAVQLGSAAGSLDLAFALRP